MEDSGGLVKQADEFFLRSPPHRQSDMVELKKGITTLEMLQTKYPEPNRGAKWDPSTVTYMLREARTLLADLSAQKSNGASPAPGQ